MRTISFEVTGQHIECTEAISDLVGNTREYVQAKFSLPTEWDGLIQIAVFTANGKNYPVLIEDGKCEVPYKVMMQEYFTVGCYAGAKTDRITTDICVVRVEESVRCQGGSDYLSIYQKMQDTLNEMVAKVNEYEAAVENYKEIVNDTMHEHCLHETHSSDGAHGLRIHDGLFQYYDGQGWVDTKAEIETICCDCERPQRVIGQIFESARESGEEDNQTAILYVNQEKEKNKKESEVKFPKTDTRQSKKKEDICCYTELPKSKKPLSLKEKLFKNRFIGGR